MPQVSEWNWGAFLLTPLWALTYRVRLGLLCYIPLILPLLSLAILRLPSYKSLGATLLGAIVLIQPFAILLYLIAALLLGLYGNQLVLQKHPLIDREKFKRQQRVWALAGLFLGVPCAYLFFDLWGRLFDYVYYWVNQL